LKSIANKHIWFCSILFCLVIQATANSVEFDGILLQDREPQKDSIPKDDYLLRGIIETNTGNFKEAYHLLSLAIKFDSSNWKAFQYKGIVESQLFGNESSILSFSKAMQLNEKDTIVYYLRGMSYFLMGDCLNSISDATKLIKLIATARPPLLLQAYRLRSQCYKKLGQFDKEVLDWSFIVENSQDPTEGLYFRGQAYFNLHLYRQAIEDMNKYLRVKNSPNAHRVRGVASVLLAYNERMTPYADSAIADLKQFVPYATLADSPSILGSIGIAYAIKGDSVSSVEYLRKCQETDPMSTPVYYALGDVELTVKRNYTRAVYYYKQVLKTNWQPTPLFYSNFGAAKVGVGDTLGALTEFEKSISLDSNNTMSLEARLKILSSLNYLQYLKNSSLYDSLSIHDITQLLRILSNDSSQISKLYVERANIYSRKKNSINNAMTDLNRAIELGPDNDAYAYFLRAAIRLAVSDGSKIKGVADAVLADINKAISLDGRLWESYLIKAYVLKYFDDDLKGSCKCIKEAVKMGGKVPSSAKKFFCKGKITKELDNYYFNPSLRDRQPFTLMPFKKH
jgi:tetratricopeptide (TPR) repeat protein